MENEALRVDLSNASRGNWGFLLAHFLTKRVLNMDAVTHPMKHLWQLQGFKAQDIGGIRLCSILMMLCK